MTQTESPEHVEGILLISITLDTKAFVVLALGADLFKAVCRFLLKVIPPKREWPEAPDGVKAARGIYVSLPRSKKERPTTAPLVKPDTVPAVSGFHITQIRWKSLKDLRSKGGCAFYTNAQNTINCKQHE